MRASVCTYTSHRTSKHLWTKLTRTSNYPYISLQADEHTLAQNYHHSVYDPFELIYKPVSTSWNTLTAFILLHSFSSHTDGFLRVQWSHLYTYLTCHTAHAGSWRQVQAQHTPVTRPEYCLHGKHAVYLTAIHQNFNLFPFTRSNDQRSDTIPQSTSEARYSRMFLYNRGNGRSHLGYFSPSITMNTTNLSKEQFTSSLSLSYYHHDYLCSHLNSWVVVKACRDIHCVLSPESYFF